MASSQSSLLFGPTNHSTPFSCNFNYTLPLKLDRNNYILWRSQVIPAIRGHNLEAFIDGTSFCPPEFLEDGDEDSSPRTSNPEHTIWQQQDQLLLSWLLSSMTEGILGHVVGHTTSRSVWQALQRVFSSQSRARLLQLRSSLQTTRKGATCMVDYLLLMKNIADNLSSAG